MRPALPADRGSALLMVLVFLAVVGVAVVAMLSSVMAATKHAAVSTQLVERSVTVDSAVAAAVAELARVPGACGAIDLSAITLNGLTPRTTCTAASGGEPAGGLALVADQVVRTGTGPFRVDGTALDRSAGWTTWVVGTVGAEITGGDLAGTDDTCETTVPSRLHVAAPGRVRCLAAGSVHLPAPADPPEAPPDQRPAAGEPVLDEATGTVACRIFRPGTYRQAPVLDADARFLPGTYRFESVGPWSIGGDRVVDAGGPLPPEARPSRCPAAAPPGEAVEPGVSWVLAGDSALTVDGAVLALGGRDAVPALRIEPPDVDVDDPGTDDPGPGPARLTVAGPARLVLAGPLVAPGATIRLADPAASVRTGPLRTGRLEVGADLTVAAPPARTVRIEAALPATERVGADGERRGDGRCVAVTAVVDLVPGQRPAVRSYDSNLPAGEDPPVCAAPAGP